VLAVIYPFLTSFAVMATGNHYLADAVAGAAITLGVFFALSLVPTAPPEPSPAAQGRWRGGRGGSGGGPIPM
jgi:hypothetical protein